ncbi:MAG: hypothetical protein J6X60_03345, partial [Ruminiclostridium sp.]|nr:hypothetical protein [Ruminiclostridium sp.]
MENLLKKALGEVLTERYSEELRAAGGSSYVVSAGFSDRMEALVRKLRRPKILKYTKYIAAAAVVMIAVASAVIIPSLINNDIGVSDITSSVTAEPPVSVPPEKTVSPTSVPVIVNTPENTTSVITVPDVITESENTKVISSDTGESATIISDSSVSTEGMSVPEPVTATKETDDDTTVLVDGNGVDSEGDDDLISEDDYDCDISEVDDDEDFVDDVTDTTEHLEAEPGQTLNEFISLNFGGRTFEELYAGSGYYSPDLSPRTPRVRLSFQDYEYDYIQDFVHTLGNAVNTGINPEGESIRKLYLDISTVKPSVVKKKPENLSAWLNYGLYFNVGSEYSDEEEDEIDDDDDISDIDRSDYLSIRLSIYDNGYIQIEDKIRYTDYVNQEHYEYRAAGNFVTDHAAVGELFSKLDKLYLKEHPFTVGEMASMLGITSATEIESISVDIFRVFDTRISHGKIDTDYIMGLLEKYSDKPLIPAETNGSSAGVDILVRNKNGAALKLLVSNNDGMIVISDEAENAYSFKGSSDEVYYAVKHTASATGIDIPMYGTLAEYLKNKNYTGFTSITRYEQKGLNGKRYILNDKAELEKLNKLLEKEFEKAEYIYSRDVRFSLVTKTDSTLYLGVDGYTRNLELTEDDGLIVRC